MVENCVKNEQCSVLINKKKSLDEVLTKIQVLVNTILSCVCGVFFLGGGLSFQLTKVTTVKYIQYLIINCSATDVENNYVFSEIPMTTKAKM